MSVAWSWSLRAIRAIQMLAGEWRSRPHQQDSLELIASLSCYRPNPVTTAIVQNLTLVDTPELQPLHGSAAILKSDFDEFFHLETGDTLLNSFNVSMNFDQDSGSSLGLDHITHFNP